MVAHFTGLLASSKTTTGTGRGVIHGRFKFQLRANVTGVGRRKTRPERWMKLARGLPAKSADGFNRVNRTV
jgi:hypothetical protein